MMRNKLLVIVLVPLSILLVILFMLDRYIAISAQARLTPLDVHFDVSLPGRTITEDNLNGDFFCDETERPKKVVILLGGSEGGKHWSTNTPYLRRLLDHKYCVLVPAYFHAPGLPDSLREISLEYFEKVFQWLSTQRQVVPDGYAVFGHSRGGELALLLASRYPQIKAVIALAPSSVLFPGVPRGLFDALAQQRSAWTYQGKPLPFVPLSASLKNASSLFTFRQRAMFEQALQNIEAVERAIIPVETINGAILCISAGNDEIWPSMQMCSQIMERLHQKDFSFHHEHVSHDYSHGWCGLDPCWTTVINFLDEHFKSHQESIDGIQRV